MHGKQADRITIPAEERHTRPDEHTELDFQAWSIRVQIVFLRGVSCEVWSISRSVLVPTNVPHKALTHTQSFHMGIWSGWWEFSDKERDKQINGSLSSLEFEKVVQGFSDWLHWSLWCLKASKLQCYQGHESHQHQFSSCTEKGDSDCTKKQEGNWIAQHHRWHSVNLSVLLGYRQWKSGMCESYYWRFVDHPSWSKHGHTIAPKWGRMKNPGLGKKTEPSRTHFALL